MQAREIQVGEPAAAPPERSGRDPRGRRGEGLRLDVYLARELDLSRGYVRRLLRRHRVRLEGRPAAKGALVRPGDRIQVAAFRHPSEGLAARPDLALPLLARGHGFVAFDKPAGLPSHPLEFDEDRTALSAALAQVPEVARAGVSPLEAGLVHRLDTATSGVLVFATEPEAWEQARRAFAERRVEKRYLALVHGRLQGAHEVALRLEHAGARMRVVASGGREAVTQMQALRADGEQTLVLVRPRTGLMHQIRVTLAHLGHPIVGDRQYGSPVRGGRHWLHALEIALLGFEARSTPPPELAP
jgi:23S rRNA pseudouridine1911/1915/1917 synthase